MSKPRLGPANAATVIVRDLDHSIAAYGQHLDLKTTNERLLSSSEASQLGWDSLSGARMVWLANALDEPWLRLVESPAASASKPFTRYGWLSLEIAVQDVDALGERLQNSPFEIIGPPADLAMSDAIRAMQVVGPDGEVLYLTQIKRPVEGFELPRARCPVDRLFIPVMMCPDRDRALAHYSKLSGNSGLRFETRIGVINDAKGLEENHEHALATLQLRGNTLIEIDQVEGLAPATAGQSSPPSGIALVHIECDHANAGVHTGAAGERYLLINNP